MISQSEAEEDVAGEEMPAPLLEGTGRGGREAVRLEFVSMDTVPSRGDDESGAAVEVERGVLRDQEARALQEREAEAERRRFATELEAALRRGRAEGKEEAEEKAEQEIAAERSSVLRTCEAFRKEREGYFGAVEAEVVKLALAIAARVLHREVKLDPLLLRGVVKVALEKILEESGTVLRVPMEDLAAWQELMEGEDAATVEVSGDVRLARGECVLETRVGKVELGVEAQLEEIEKGFFDLLQRRPT